jgi:hypothetical protein
MFQYACGYALSQSNNTPLKLDITGFDDYPLRSYELDKFNLQADYASEEEIKRLKYKPLSLAEKAISKILRKGIPFSDHYYSDHYYKERHFHYDPDLRKVGQDIYLDGYWQSEKYFAAYRDELLRTFTLKADLHEQTLRYQKMIEETEAVSLHIRRGDYVSNPHTNSVHGTCSLEYYQNAVRYITVRVKDPHFYIFSDDLAWAKENLVFIDGITFVKLDDKVPDHEEMYLMSQCKHNIIANSSFSWWGAWLNQNTQKIVIAPKKWLNDNTINTNDLIPEGWLRL